MWGWGPGRRSALGTSASFLLVAAIAISTLGAAESHPDVEVGSLGVGDSVFWQGPFVGEAGVSTTPVDPAVCSGPGANMVACTVLTYPASAAAPWWERTGRGLPICGTAGFACLDYVLNVSGSGALLKVAIDVPSGRDVFALELFTPDGKLAAADSTYSYFHTVELRALAPSAGRWTIRVIPMDVNDSSFRMRAALEGPAPTPGERRPLLPNLRQTPPFEVTFAGCQLTEIVLNRPTRCLRFSIGPANWGEGPLHLVVGRAGRTGGVNTQRIYYTVGPPTDRPAGRYEWHAAHGHYHHVATGDLHLLRVTDQVLGTLEDAGQGPKQGFCMGDYLIADWSSFAQDAQYSSNGSCQGVGDAPLGTEMGLTKGWGDVYGYFVEGNYVEFGDNPDGLYLIRSTTDPGNDILETDDTDNTSYTYIRVTGDRIDVLERARGSSPWDLAKVIANDERPVTP